MNPQAHRTKKRERPANRSQRTVAICHLDPERFVSPGHLLPGGASNRLLAINCAEAIAAALAGEVDALVVDGNEVRLDALTALSFLQRERPEVAIYLYTEHEDSPPVLQRMRLAA